VFIGELGKVALKPDRNSWPVIRLGGGPDVTRSDAAASGRGASQIVTAFEHGGETHAVAGLSPMQ
jgi:hypothetical protein